MSTRDEVLSSRNSLSEYYVHLESAENICLSPFLDPNARDGVDESNSFFLHHPSLLFGNPPRTLRRGHSRDGEPICLIHNTTFWRKWKVQFRSNLGDIMDPRGLLKWEHRSRPDNKTGDNDLALRGYKVRSWRVWGESGGEYHRSVNARRRVLLEDGMEEKSTFEPACAEESVKLKWSSPLTNVRRYDFSYAGIDFFWEGTRDIAADDTWARLFLPFHHLKLVGRIAGQEDVYVGEFVAGFSVGTFGRLWIFDSQLAKLLEDSRRTELTMDKEFHKLHDLEADGNYDDIRTTRLFDLVMATSMCMVMGEWQKRMSVMILLYSINIIASCINIFGS